MSAYTDIVQKDSAHLIKEHSDMFAREMRSIVKLKDIIRGCGMDTQAVRHVGDIAGGLGHNSFHLKGTFPNASFTIIDILPEQIKEARQKFLELGIANRFSAEVGDIYHLPLVQYDVTICWNTIFVLDDYQEAVRQLIRATTPGGSVFFSLLLNIHDVDLKTRITDYSRASSQAGLHMEYNTYSKERFLEFCRGVGIRSVSAYEFKMDIDLENRFKGVGTYTLKLEDGSRLQISGGILMQWYIVYIIV